MIRSLFFMYFVIFSIPLCLGLTVWQSARFSDLNMETKRLEAIQEDLIEQNKRLIAEITIYSSSERVENAAVHDLGLTKVRPEDVLQISIEHREGGR